LLLGALCALGGGRNALADVHPLRAISQTCRFQSCQRTIAYGSAVSIGRTTAGEDVFLTAAHCTSGNAPRIEIGIQGQWHPATILARAENPIDVALLGVDFLGTAISGARIAETPAESGTEVSLTGFPQGGTYRRRTGTVIADRFAEYDLVIDQPASPGESGGGIFNAQGELVGIIAATAPAESPTQTLAVGITPIRKLLNQAFTACRPIGPQPSPAAKPAAEIAKLQRELDELRTRLKALESLAAKPAPPDPFVLERIERLEQLEIPVQVLTPDGELLDEARYRLGQPLQFRLIPKPDGENGR
jgi:hypothetical protein